MKVKKFFIGVIGLMVGAFTPTINGYAQENVTDQHHKLIYPFPFAPSEGMVNKMESEYREEVCLNGYWQFQPEAMPDSYKQGAGMVPELPEVTEDGWSQEHIKIPSPWNINSFANNGLEGPDHRNYPSYPREWENVKMGWLKKEVTVPDDWNDKQIFLYFEAVAGYAEVYINGKKVGENFDLFLPFNIDITDDVKPGEIIEVLVGVRSQSLFEDRSTIGRRILPAGSMWGSHINGIWQDVYLLALPKIHIANLFVKPLVSKEMLELEVTLQNNTARKADVVLQGNVSQWINRAGTDVNSAPVPTWELGKEVLWVTPSRMELAAGALETVVLQVPVKENVLQYWTPESPNLYAILLSVENKKTIVDRKYERFGWREWTLQGNLQCLNGKPYSLRGDSWHFMGIPQMTRRYSWAWFTAIKGMNGNAVRLHAQVYPRFYLDMADELGICVLDETANWGSDGGPKFDSELFWENSKRHLERLVLRDRNHASIFGWSISNENKPVILNVIKRPDLMPLQKKAWEEWYNIVRLNDPTRPWISSDGEEDGDGILPVAVGHYGDDMAMRNWAGLGKPWGVGEDGMAYYGTPEQVSVYNGERAYESQEGRMEGIAKECYNLITGQRDAGASYCTVFNMVWYGLKPLPLGKKDIGFPPQLEEDGIFFTEYREGVPGVQPERIGPYSTTLNPGYDPNLPLYQEWPLYSSMRAANAPGGRAWSQFAEIENNPGDVSEALSPIKLYKDVVFIGDQSSNLKQIMDLQGVKFSDGISEATNSLYIIDGSIVPDTNALDKVQKQVAKGTDIWIWGITPETVSAYNGLLPFPIVLDTLKRSSFLPVQKSWMKGLKNSDFYFCELQKTDASLYSLRGAFVDEGEVLLDACKTDWRKWNKRPEELKTAGTLRSEYECIAATPVFVMCRQGASTFYVNTVCEFTNSEKGYTTLATILKNAGIVCEKKGSNGDEVFFLRDKQVNFPIACKEKMVQEKNGWAFDFYLFSPRPLNDLLIEPNVPKLSLSLKSGQCRLLINGELFQKDAHNNGNEIIYDWLPLFQGWNKITIIIPSGDRDGFSGYFKCDNQLEFLSLLKMSFENPDKNLSKE